MLNFGLYALSFLLFFYLFYAVTVFMQEELLPSCSLHFLCQKRLIYTGMLGGEQGVFGCGESYLSFKPLKKHWRSGF